MTVKFSSRIPYRWLAAITIAVVSTLPLKAELKINQTDADNRAKALINAGSPSDSIKILLDVYDLSDKSHRNVVRPQILALAQRTDNNVVLKDVVKDLASSTDDTDDLARLIEISENIPEKENENKKTIETLLIMEKADADAKNAHGEDLQNRIVEYAKTGMSFTGDPYEEIQNMYRAIAFLGTSSQGPMYLEYITRLGELVDNLPEKDHAIKNLYYTTAALFYTRKRDYKKAIENDRKLIEQLDLMKKHYEDDGKSTEDLDYFYYISYRRMLRNFMGLSPEEIQQVYDKCIELTNKNERIMKEFGVGGLTNSYYYVATHQFDKAVPELRKSLESPTISEFRRMELTGLLAWALRETGDTKNELKTLRAYTLLRTKDIAQRRADTYKEIELRNNVNKIIAQEYLEQKNQKNENRRMRIISITLVYVLAVVLIFLCRGYFKLKQKVAILEKGNKKLRTNIEHMMDDGLPSGTHSLLKSKNKLKG